MDDQRDSNAPSQRHLIDAAWAQVAGATPGGVGDEPAPPREVAGQLWDALGSAGGLPGYAFVGEIHRGGQGVVYEAVQRSTGRTVAVKLMRGGPFAGEREKARFEREVRLLALLRHPNIVTIYDSGAVAGCAYFVMDYIPGSPLDEWVSNQRPPLNDRLRLFASICEAVNVAHLRGIIHRDLKPGNIRIDESGAPHILDFGLAKTSQWDDGDESSELTHTGHFVGSVPWASPEQVEGRPDLIDVRTDVYSLGVMLYQLVTDRLPYPASSNVRDALDHILHTEPADPRQVARNLDGEIATIALKCLQKDRERRYQTAGELARDIRHHLAGEPIEARGDSVMYVLAKHLSRHRATAVVAAGFVFLLALSSVVAWSLYVRSENDRAIADARSAEAVDRLWDAYLAQARAGRFSNRVGRRFQSLEALAKAARIRPDRTLRDEAIACLNRSDLRLEKTILSPRHPSAIGLRSIDRYAHAGDGGTYFVRAVEDNRVLAELPGHDAAVRALIFSPSGRYLAVKHGDPNRGHLWVWDIGQGRSIHSPVAPAAVLKLPAGTFRSDGIAFGMTDAAEWVALTQSDGKTHLYDLPSGTPRMTLPAGGGVLHLAVDGEGRRIAESSYADRVVRIWETETGGLLHTLTPPGFAADVAWSWDGRLLACPAYDYQVYLYEAESGALVRTLSGHQGAVVRAMFDPTGTVLASSSWDGTTRLWDVEGGTSLLQPMEDVSVVGFGDRLVLGDADGETLGLWRYEGDGPMRRFATGRGLGAAGLGVVDRSGRILTTAGNGGVELFDLATGASLGRLHEGVAWSAFLLPDQSAVIASTGEGVLRWPVRITEGPAPGGQRAGTPVPLGDERAGRPVALGDDRAGRPVALGDDRAGRPVALGDDRAGTPVPLGEEPAGTPVALSIEWDAPRVLQSGGWFRHATLNRAGDRFIASGRGLRVFDVAGGDARPTSGGDAGATSGGDARPTSGRDAGATSGGDAGATSTGTEARSTSGGDARSTVGVEVVAEWDTPPGMERPSISPDGRWIFTGTWRGEYGCVWDGRTGALVHRFPGRSVRGRFGPAGRRLIICDGPRYVIYEVGSWKRLHTINRSREDLDLAAPVAFAPDGRTAAVMHSFFAVRLIDVASGETLATLPNPDMHGVTSLDFGRPDTLVAVSPGGAVLVWDLAAIRASLAEIGLDW